jgi:hypothetical protein
MSIVDRVNEDPRVARFFRRTWIPDELLLPSLAMASPFRDEVRDDNLWFSRWTGGAHPQALGIDDFDELAAASERGGSQGGRSPVKLFARKFPADGPTDILDRLDRERLAYRPIQAAASEVTFDQPKRGATIRNDTAKDRG